MKKARKFDLCEQVFPTKSTLTNWSRGIDVGPAVLRSSRVVASYASNKDIHLSRTSKPEPEDGT